jgi:hypothetical protein
MSYHPRPVYGKYHMKILHANIHQDLVIRALKEG